MKIYIKNIEVLMSIGCHKHEYEMKTKLLISIILEYRNISDFTKGEHIINYNNVIKLVNDITSTKHFIYIEELVAVIAESLKSLNDLVKGGSVKVQKCIMGNIAEEFSCEMSF